MIARIGNVSGSTAERDSFFKGNEPSFAPPGSYYHVPAKHFSKGNPRTLEEWQLQRLTVEYLKRQPDWFPRKNTTWRDYAVEVAAASVDEGLRHLKKLAPRRSKHALAAIADIAITATKTLSGIATQDPKRLIPIARHRFLWPFLKARKDRFGDDHKHLVEKIQVGYATPISEDALARVRATNIVAKLAIALLCCLESCRNSRKFASFNRVLGVKFSEWESAAMQLKRFSAKTWVEWFEVAWTAVCADHHRRPETDPELRKLGQYRAEHTIDKRGGTTTKTKNANIRDGIKDKLRKAIQRLAEVPN